MHSCPLTALVTTNALRDFADESAAHSVRVTRIVQETNTAHLVCAYPVDRAIPTWIASTREICTILFLASVILHAIRDFVVELAVIIVRVEKNGHIVIVMF